ncbi:MAG: chitobiase/beta-hexosaminidase C-terminal domain-containing protein [Lachnospiraceae bacterium]|nr:chitobiase/beta-hexosaminidase C-terminal domain-containing protein [Lachnospiraceae bacterium]
MKCKYCGHEIPEGMLYCDACGKEVRIVPDYNPLDDMLTEQIRFSIDEQNDGKEPPTYFMDDKTRVDVRSNTGRRVNARATGRTVNTCATGKTVNTRATGRTVNARATGRTTVVRQPESQRIASANRKKKEQRKARLRRKRRIVLLVMAFCIAAVGGISYALYINSYTGIVSTADKARKNQEYKRAETYYKEAISKKKAGSEAYTGLAKTYLGMGEDEKAESLFLDAIDDQSKNADIYDACFQFYLDTDQALKIPALLYNASDSVQEKLSDYVVSEPVYSLDDKKTYDDVQQVTLAAKKGMTIYYTTDGKDPTFHSKKYKDPIQLDEGETVVRAIAVNKKGVPSDTAEKIYTIEFPIEEAPAISPSTGQYESGQSIEIKVPSGYTAYYTMSGKTPTTSSKKYTGPIKMPEGETLFKAILVNSAGRSSGVTTRNYVLDTSSFYSSRSNRVITGKGGSSDEDDTDKNTEKDTKEDTEE